MAFGDLIDIATDGEDPRSGSLVVGTGLSATVAIGDLVVVVVSEETNNTTSAVNDNLGNSYTQQNAGTDAGTFTGKMYWARVTTAGTLSSVTVTQTAHASDGANCGVAVFAGPFRASPLDQNPANVQDATSSYSAPATGTLSQAAELVISWATAGLRGSGTDYVPTSPLVQAVEYAPGSGPFCRVMIGYKVVAATTTTTPAWTEAANQNTILGTATFMQDLSVSVSPAAANLTLSTTRPLSFGSIMAFAAEQGTAITDPVTIDGSSDQPLNSTAVEVGDLIIATLGQQTALTLTAVTDNLGNTYVAQNAGTDTGNVTGRMFYARVTVPGNLTSVSFDTTSSVNNYAATVVVFKGPFIVSPLDENPVNLEGDITSPVTCPDPGFTTISKEIHFSWVVSEGGNRPTGMGVGTFLNSIVDSESLVSVGQGYTLADATGESVHTFTYGSNPTDTITGTATFMGDINDTPFRTDNNIGRPGQANLTISSVAPNFSHYTLIPDADVSDGTWIDQASGTVLFEGVNDFDDNTYIQSNPGVRAPGPVTDIAQVGFSNPTGTLGAPFEVEYRYKKTGDGIVNLNVRLMQGAVEIVEWNHVNVSASVVQATQTLTAPQLASITNMNDLRIEFEAVVVAPPPGGQLRLSSEPPVVVGGFSPSQFGSDLVAWFDATPPYVQDENWAECTDGVKVGRWIDRSNNGFHVRQGYDPERPTYRTASSVMNGKPAVEFAPYEHYLRTKVGANGVKLGTGVTAVSMFAVVSAGNGIGFANDNRIISYRTAGDLNDYTSAGGFMLVLNSYYTPSLMQLSPYRRDDSLPTTGQYLMRPVSLDVPYRFGAVYTDAGTRKSFLNGVEQSEAASTLGNYAASGEMSVGSNPHMAGSSDTAQWGGWISEIIFVKRALTANELLALDAYFRSKWGFSS